MNQPLVPITVKGANVAPPTGRTPKFTRITPELLEKTEVQTLREEKKKEIEARKKQGERAVVISSDKEEENVSEELVGEEEEDEVFVKIEEEREDRERFIRDEMPGFVDLDTQEKIFYVKSQ